MKRVDDIGDFQTLKQAAQLLETTVSRLQTEVSQLRLQLALRDGQARPVEQTTILEEELAKLKAKHFGTSSERRPKEDGTSEEKKKKGKAKPKGHGPTPQPRLPIQETTYEINSENANCPDCGKPREAKPGLTKESELITVVGVEFKLEKVTQLIYGCDCPETLVTAPGPDRVTPGGRYSLEFAVFAAAQKYLDHMPLARLQRMMDRKGLDITRATIFDQLESLASLLDPTWRALHEYTLGADWLHCDETYWPMLDGPGTSKWWTWCLASDDAVFYDIHKSRSGKAAKAMLNGFEGVLITDGYSAYNAVQRAGPNITHAYCWAHVRRKFVEAEAAYPDKVQAPIKWIGQLFEIERNLPKIPRGASLAERNEICAIRQDARESQARPIVDTLRQWAYDTLPTVLPSSGLARAIEYMLKLWSGLILFISDPRVPIDNNHAEREVRGVVVGRKNHYGSKSKRGTEVAAIFYSLFESAKLAGLDPEAYVLEAARRALHSPGTVTLPADLAS